MQTMTQHPVKLIDQKTVAEMYGVCPKTIENWSRKVKGFPQPHVDRKNFKRWLYADVANHIESMNKAESEERAA